MGRASKGKSKGKQSFAKGVGSVVETAKSVQKGMAEFRTEWAEKFNSLQNRFDKIIPTIAQQFASLQMNQNIVNQCVDSIDIQQQAMMKILANLYAKEALHKAIITSLLPEGVTWENIDVGDEDEIKSDGMDVYMTIAKQSVELAKEDRAAAIAAKEQQEKEAAAAATEAETAKKEAETAEEALIASQSRDQLVGETGGQGADIPSGADVFGG